MKTLSFTPPPQNIRRESSFAPPLVAHLGCHWRWQVLLLPHPSSCAPDLSKTAREISFLLADAAGNHQATFFLGGDFGGLKSKYAKLGAIEHDLNLLHLMSGSRNFMKFLCQYHSFCLQSIRCAGKAVKCLNGKSQVHGKNPSKKEPFLCIRLRILERWQNKYNSKLPPSRVKCIM